MNNIFQKITNFVKYHNAFAMSLVLVFLFSGIIFASSDTAYDAVVGEKIITKSGIDNTYLLEIDLDKLDLQMTITSISEDDKKYYIEYTFNTFGIQNNIWQAITNHPTLSVYKEALGDNDLGLHITEKFSQVADYQLSYLKEAQDAEIEKGKQQIVETTQYTGLYHSLIGKVLDIKEKVLPGYEPVVVAPVITPQPAPSPDPASPPFLPDFPISPTPPDSVIPAPSPSEPTPPDPLITPTPSINDGITTPDPVLPDPVPPLTTDTPQI